MFNTLPTTMQFLGFSAFGLPVFELAAVNVAAIILYNSMNTGVVPSSSCFLPSLKGSSSFVNKLAMRRRTGGLRNGQLRLFGASLSSHTHFQAI